MIQLEVGVVASSRRDAVQRGAIVTIEKIATLDGRKVSSRKQKVEAVDIAIDSPRYKSFSFEDPGIYEVSIRHPSGSDTREITLTESTKLTFNVGSSRRTVDFALPFDLYGPDQYATILEQLNKTGWVPGTAGLLTSAPVFSRSDFWVTLPMSEPSYSDFANSDLRSSLLFGTAPPIGRGVLEVPWLASSATIDAPSSQELENLYHDLRGQGEVTLVASPSRWSNSFGKSGIDLVSMPWLWFPLFEEERRSVEIRISRKRAGFGATTMLDVRDTEWGALLDFVTQGRMQDAALVARSLVGEHNGSHIDNLPEYALQGKLKEPLVAALGGIILVSNVSDLRHHRWDRWLENLANWFPNMPDAAAIYGYRMLQIGEFESAHRWLRQALEAGLPYFSATFRLLMLAFSQLEDQESLDLIAPAAAAVDVTQPFTVIHVPGSADVGKPTIRGAQG